MYYYHYRCNVGLLGGSVEELPKTGVLDVNGKAGVSGRENSVSVSERYEETESFLICKISND